MKKQMLYILALYLSSSFSLYSEPWGIDADLINLKPPPSSSSPSPLRRCARIVIRFHQEVLSPADGPRSSYFPSSSQYMLQAVDKHGFFVGVSMGCDRLMRENNEPWVYRTRTINGLPMKFDPIK
jgi:uncharacterized protein